MCGGLMDNLAGLLSILRSLGIYPRNESLYETAMTHSSYVNEHPSGTGDNERLEFLGDAVLSLVVSEFLFNDKRDMPEGSLTRLRSQIVCEPSLSAAAQALGLGDYLRLGRGEEATGGRLKASVLAGAVEALVAAIYLDNGLDAVRRFVSALLKDARACGEITTDYKTMLQESVQASCAGRLVTYETVAVEGPDHDRRFTVDVIIDGLAVARGVGKSKRAAEQEAARRALSTGRGSDG